MCCYNKIIIDNNTELYYSVWVYQRHHQEFTCVYHYLTLFTYVYLRLSLFVAVYLSLLAFIIVYHCLLIVLKTDIQAFREPICSTVDYIIFHRLF